VVAERSGDAAAVCNPPLVLRALVNLLTNAIRHTRAGDTIRVLIEPDHGLVALSVLNPGLEIPAPVRAQMFDRFYRADSSRSRRQAGHGLGLAIVAAVARMHGGTVFVERIGQANRVGLTLPARDSQTTVAPVKGFAASGLRPLCSRRTRRHVQPDRCDAIRRPGERFALVHSGDGGDDGQAQPVVRSANLATRPLQPCRSGRTGAANVPARSDSPRSPPRSAPGHLPTRSEPLSSSRSSRSGLRCSTGWTTRGAEVTRQTHPSHRHRKPLTGFGREARPRGTR
jgi:hypothetical protein